MSDKLCSVVISWDLKKGQFPSKIHCYAWLKESVSKNVHLLFKGLWRSCLSFNSFIPFFFFQENVAVQERGSTLIL